MNDEAKTSEENHKGDVSGEIYSVRERREWRSDHTKGTCVIWCGRMPFWNIVVGTFVLRVTGIWGRSEVWRSQYIRWWTDTPCYNKKGEGSEECWGSDWVLPEDDLFP